MGHSLVDWQHVANH